MLPGLAPLALPGALPLTLKPYCAAAGFGVRTFLPLRLLGASDHPAHPPRSIIAANSYVFRTSKKAARKSFRMNTSKKRGHAPVRNGNRRFALGGLLLGTLGYVEGDLYVAAGGAGVGADLVSGLNQLVRGFGIDSGQADVQPGRKLKLSVSGAEVDFGVDGGIGRQIDFSFAGDKLHCREEASGPSGGE